MLRDVDAGECDVAAVHGDGGTRVIPHGVTAIMPEGEARGDDRSAVDGHGRGKRGGGRDRVAVAAAHGDVAGDGGGAVFNEQVCGGFGTGCRCRIVADADAAGEGVDLTLGSQYDGPLRNRERRETCSRAITVRAGGEQRVLQGELCCGAQRLSARIGEGQHAGTLFDKTAANGLDQAGHCHVGRIDENSRRAV